MPLNWLASLDQANLIHLFSLGEFTSPVISGVEPDDFVWRLVLAFC